jgi:dTDP-4-dehydrorhamnose reductase
MTKILLTGKNGQVGSELQQTLGAIGSVIAVDLAELDLTDAAAVRKSVQETRPDLIVNPAAYTQVDKAESEPEIAHAVNGIAPGLLAQEAAALGIPIIHYSTDYVFDGTKRRPYTEKDEPNPTNIYGKSKLAGERAVIASGARHIILRLSWVYGVRGSNFLLTMLKLAENKKEIRVVGDQYGAPTWAREIARGSTAIAKTLIGDTSTPSGIYHLPAEGETTWCNFASEIFGAARKSGLLKTAPRVISIPTSEYKTAATRPAYSVLSGDKLSGRFGVRLLDWQTQLRATIDLLV